MSNRMSRKRKPTVRLGVEVTSDSDIEEPKKKKAKTDATPKKVKLGLAKTSLLHTLEAHAESVHIEISHLDRRRLVGDSKTPVQKLRLIEFENYARYYYSEKKTAIQKHGDRIVVSMTKFAYIMDKQFKLLQKITYGVQDSVYSGRDGLGATPIGDDRIAMLNDGNQILVWDWSTVKKTAEQRVRGSYRYLQGIGDEYLMFADGKSVVFSIPGKGKIRNIATFEKVNMIHSFDFLPNGNIVFVTNDDIINLYDLSTESIYGMPQNDPFKRFLGNIVMMDRHRVLIETISKEDYPAHDFEVWNVRSGERELTCPIGGSLACKPVLVAHLTVAYAIEGQKSCKIIDLQTKATVTLPEMGTKVTAISLIGDFQLLVGCDMELVKWTLPESLFTYDADELAQKILKCWEREVFCDISIIYRSV
jgi:WD40 repeat protein